MICPMCGVENCNDLYMKALSKEFENKEYGKVHHLTVLCYNLQHNLYSKKGWFAVRELLSKFIYDGLTPEMARKIHNINKKDYRITTGEKLTNLDEMNWSFTIANINFDLPDKYCISINNWVKYVQYRLEHLIPKIKL